MSNRIYRRAPLARVVFGVVVLLVVFELAVLAGFLEIPIRILVRIAPFAEKPFMDLVGETPGSPFHLLTKTALQDESNETGLSNASIPVLMKVEEPSVETHAPVEEKSAPPKNNIPDIESAPAPEGPVPVG